jgi:hypothetical protein
MLLAVLADKRREEHPMALQLTVAGVFAGRIDSRQVHVRRSGHLATASVVGRAAEYPELCPDRRRFRRSGSSQTAARLRALGALQHSPECERSSRERVEEGSPPRCHPREERLGGFRIRRPVSADRATSLLPQAVRAGCRAHGLVVAGQDRCRARDEGTHSRSAELMGTYQKAATNK